GRDVVQTLRPPIRGQEAKITRELTRQCNLQSVIGGARVIRDETDGGERARTMSIAIGIKAALVGVLRSGAGSIDGGICFDEARQVRTFIPDVTNVENVILRENSFDRKIPIL